jgi:hypothetical protein
MSAITYSGRVEHGQIKLKDAVALPEGAQVYVVIAPVDKPQGSEWARELYELFEPARLEAEGRSEDEVNTDIDAAIAAVRGKRA